MTPEQMQEAYAICAAATPQPWNHDPEDRKYVRRQNGTTIGSVNLNDNDAIFIARARELLPLALLEIEDLRRRIRLLDAANSGHIAENVRLRNEVQPIFDAALAWADGSDDDDIPLLNKLYDLIEAMRANERAREAMSDG